MKFAIQDGKRIEPTPGARGICRSCESDVKAACGTKREWHFRHYPAQPDCVASQPRCVDSWSPIGVLPSETSGMWVSPDHQDFWSYVSRAEDEMAVIDVGSAIAIPEPHAKRLAELGVCISDDTYIIDAFGMRTYVIMREEPAQLQETDNPMVQDDDMTKVEVPFAHWAADVQEEKVRDGVICGWTSWNGLECTCAEIESGTFRRNNSTGKLMTRV